MGTRLAIMTVAAMGLLANPVFAGDDGRPQSSAPPSHISILSQHDGAVRAANTPPRAVVVRPRFVRQPFFVFGEPVVSVPPVFYAEPTPVYVPVYVPTATASIAPSDVPPPVEPAREVVYPTGRWELHGNGVTAPYVWVWTPSRPPVEATPSAEPPPPPSPPSS